MLLRYVTRNLTRHPLRAALTILTVSLIILAFGLLRTMITAWYGDSIGTPPDRLRTRHAVSLTFQLPVTYQERIAAIPGVSGVSYGNWFGGRWKDGKAFFPRFAVDPVSYLAVHPEIQLPASQREAFLRDRRACIVGQELAAKRNWQVGDIVRIQGSLYPGDWEFTIKGIYTGTTPTADEGNMYLHWVAVDERRRIEDPDRAGTVGWFVVRMANPEKAAQVSAAIDRTFTNSMAETRTETEQAFRANMIAMSGAVIRVVEIMSFLILGISLLVVANAMAMTVRERHHEYGILKTMGFRAPHLGFLIFGESVCLALFGGILGVALLYPASKGFGMFLAGTVGGLFGTLELPVHLPVLAVSLSVGIGLLGAVIPFFLCLRSPIREELRHVG